MPKIVHNALGPLKIRAISEPAATPTATASTSSSTRRARSAGSCARVVRGKRRDIGLGGLRVVSLAEAREQALAYRKLAAERRRPDGGAPQGTAPGPDLRGGGAGGARRALERLEERRSIARNGSTRWPIRVTRRSATGASIRSRRRTCSRCSRRSGSTRPETARRVRQRIGAVLDWAKAAGFREGENPVAGVAKGLPRQPDRKAHHAALPYAEVPGFLAALHEVDISLSRAARPRVPGAHCDAHQRSAGGEVGRDRPGRRDLDDPARAHEDRTAAQGPAVASAAWRSSPRRGSCQATALTSFRAGRSASRCRTWSS